jgi:hypothetical protein
MSTSLQTLLSIDSEAKDYFHYKKPQQMGGAKRITIKPRMVKEVYIVNSVSKSLLLKPGMINNIARQ